MTMRLSGLYFVCAALLAAALVVPALPVAAQDSISAARKSSQKRTIVGFTESAQILPRDIVSRAKVDTGARTSSLHAQDIIPFTRNGRLWVRFHITNRENRTQMFERPVVRHVRIKDLTGPSLSRPVIMLGICVADVFRVTEVNLSNRTGFNFPLLIGRRFMRQAIMVDPGRQFTRAPRCDISPAALRELDAIPGLPAQDMGE